MKKKYKYVFVILVYRNTKDLIECIDSIKKKIESYTIIVVNAFYDEESKIRCKSIAEKNHCDFINIENKGYSYGNNKGIDFALQNYKFEYLIVANPDTEILEFNGSSLDQQPFDIFAPCITTIRNIRQNPMGFTHNKSLIRFEYIGFKHSFHHIVFFAILTGKLLRSFSIILQKIKRRSIYPIYVAHGSFVIFRADAIRKLHPVYDENMFLFAEEGVLAAKAAKSGLKTCYFSPISIKHKEDGSMKLSNFSLSNLLRESNIYYYEHYER